MKKFTENDTGPLFYIAMGFVILLVGIIVSVWETKTSQVNSFETSVLAPVVKINNNCSAVAVSSRHLLTAAHCVRDPQFKSGFFQYDVVPKRKISTAEPVKVVEAQKHQYRLVHADGNKDLALLVTDTDMHKLGTALVAKELCVSEGDRVWAVGYPGAMIRTVTEGEYNGYQVVNNAIRTRVTAPIFQGNSGGGLFQKCNGRYELIGISSAVFGAGLQKVPHMNISVSLDDIRSMFDNLGIDYNG